MTSQLLPLVIASTREWNLPLASAIRERTGRETKWLSMRNELTVEVLDEIQPEYVFLPHWSHIVPREVHERFECIVFHMTDVPFGRGGSPAQNLISRGIYETKMTAMRCVSDLDAGPVYMKRPLSLHGSAEEIYLRARDVIEDMIVEILEQRPVPTPQQGVPTVFKRRTPAQGNIASLGTISQVFDWIRMLDAEGYPSAFADVGRFRLEFTRAARYESGVQADVRITERAEEDEAT